MASSPDPSETEPLINKNDALQSYYASLESRIGYRLVLGGTRHFGYWEQDTWWPFPLTPSLRRMEDKLVEILNLPKGSTILDAGCGYGHVALHLIQAHGMRIAGIDVIDRHIARCRRNIASAGLPEGAFTVTKMDYHHLESLEDDSLEGAYTMETLVHATDPEAVLAGFHRILRPGGRVALFEYDHRMDGNATQEMVENMKKINKYAAMPTNDRSKPGMFKQLLEDAGFQDVQVTDMSENIRPMCRIFFLLGFIPYLIIRALGLQQYFINTVAGFETYRGKGNWRYIAISATKPGPPIEAPKTR